MPLMAEASCSRIRPAMAANRKTPSDSKAQPSHRKFCRPCKTPNIIGMSSANTPAPSVSASTHHEGRFKAATNASPFTHAAMNTNTVTASTTRVSAHCSRAMRKSSASVLR